MGVQSVSHDACSWNAFDMYETFYWLLGCSPIAKGTLFNKLHLLKLLNLSKIHGAKHLSSISLRLKSSKLPEALRGSLWLENCHCTFPSQILQLIHLALEESTVEYEFSRSVVKLALQKKIEQCRPAKAEREWAWAQRIRPVRDLLKLILADIWQELGSALALWCTTYKSVLLGKAGLSLHLGKRIPLDTAATQKLSMALSWIPETGSIQLAKYSAARNCILILSPLLEWQSYILRANEQCSVQMDAYF